MRLGVDSHRGLTIINVQTGEVVEGVLEASLQQDSYSFPKLQLTVAMLEVRQPADVEMEAQQVFDQISARLTQIRRSNEMLYALIISKFREQLVPKTPTQQAAMLEESVDIVPAISLPKELQTPSL